VKEVIMTMTMKRTVVGILMVALMSGAQALRASDSTVSRVRAYQMDSWRIWVSAGWHRVTVDGDGDTDLDLYVRAADGHLLDSDDDETDFCVTSFFMARGGYIEIYVRNLGRVSNEYELTVR
jgi:hypothetical protein